jgi:subtilisin family serine protease
VKRFRRALVILGVVLAVGALPLSQAGANSDQSKTYIVVFAGDYAVDGTYAVESTYAVLCNYAVAGTYAVGDDYAVGCNYAVTPEYAVYAVAHDYAVSLVQAAGGTVTGDMLKQTGTLVVSSANELFDEMMRGYAVVDEAAEDYSWQGVPSYAVGPQQECPDPDDPICIPTLDESQLTGKVQWDMQQICVIDNTEWGCSTQDAHDVETGEKPVEVGILDTGIDGDPDTGHPDLRNNVNCALGRDSIFATQGLLVINPAVETFPNMPCKDNGFHGTHVAGTVAADDNVIGIIGIAPDVTLVPVKVCDSTGYCYASAVVDGITYAGDKEFEVINMSFFVDDNKFLESHEFKCSNDPPQRTFRQAVERAIQYARNQGVTPVAALGNSDTDLAHPKETNPDYPGQGNECDVVPAETQGVIGTMSVGRQSQKAGYSNYGTGATDVAAPGGAGNTGDCMNTILSTIPGGLYACIQGTSMASPHAAGVAALIVSRFGSMGTDNDWKLSPTKVESLMQASAVDLYNPGSPNELKGYDTCFGNGRIHALRAVLHQTAVLRDDVPECADGQPAP